MRVYQFRHVGLAKTAIIAEKYMKSIGNPAKNYQVKKSYTSGAEAFALCPISHHS